MVSEKWSVGLYQVILCVMKTAVSIPEHVFEQAERVARSRGWTRSYLYTEAVRAFMEQLEDDPVTSALDALADELAVEPVASSGRALIDSGAWQW